MDPVQNPFAPGAGRRPPELAGRDDVLADFDVLIERCQAGRGERGRMLHGLRGVGKTVLLNEFQSRVSRRGWILGKAEAAQGAGLLRRLTQSLHQSLRETTGRHDVSRLRRLLGVFKAFTVKVDPGGTYTFGVELDPVQGRADTGDLTVDLTELMIEMGRTARDLGIGVALVIDEMQDVPQVELTAINTAAHAVGQGADPLPVVVVGAGLPSLPAVLAEANTYAERLFEYRSVGPLADDAAAAALLRPSAALGVAWTEDALGETLAVTRGYPYFLQAYGKRIWDYSTGTPITADDARVGINYAQRDLDEGFYLSRWNRATPAQRVLIRVMADFGDEVDVPMSEIAARLNRKQQHLSVARDQLLKKGLIYAPDRGIVAFTVPGMAEFVRRQPD